jgi:enoyl-CoA hydratase
MEEDGALHARIANEARANALDEAILDDLVSLLEGPRAAAARVVLLAGAGDRHFSAGLDLGDRAAGELPAFVREGERRLGRAARAIACDWRIARRGARLGMPAARLGVVYAADGLRRFVAAMGPARTRRLFLTGAPVDADEALRIGLVDEVADEGALWDAARAAADDVARAAPLAVAGTRAIVRAIEDGAPAEAVDATADHWRERAFGSEDLREGLRAFRERRPPGFRGG